MTNQTKIENKNRARRSTEEARDRAVEREARAEDERAARKAVKNAVADAKRHWGVGWDNITSDMRSAYVCAKVLAQIANMDEDTISANICRRVIRIAAEACAEEV